MQQPPGYPPKGPQSGWGPGYPPPQQGYQPQQGYPNQQGYPPPAKPMPPWVIPAAVSGAAVLAVLAIVLVKASGKGRR